MSLPSQERVNLISLEAAQNLVVETAAPLATEVVHLEDGYGREGYFSISGREG
jgi:hypothetical protein